MCSHLPPGTDTARQTLLLLVCWAVKTSPSNNKQGSAIAAGSLCASLSHRACSWHQLSPTQEQLCELLQSIGGSSNGVMRVAGATSSAAYAVQAAAAAEVQTELASRVSNWRLKIQPLLDEQDARPSFDIHLYGDQVLDKLARLSCQDPTHPVELEASTVCTPPPAAQERQP